MTTTPTHEMQKGLAQLDAEQRAMADEKERADAVRLVALGVAADFSAIRDAEIAGTVTAERADHLRDEVHRAQTVAVARLEAATVTAWELHAYDGAMLEGAPAFVEGCPGEKVRVARLATPVSVHDGGRIAYQAYAASTGGKTYDGRDMPTWEGLTPRIRDAWNAAAGAVIGRRSLHEGGHAATALRPPSIFEPVAGATTDGAAADLVTRALLGG